MSNMSNMANESSSLGSRTIARSLAIAEDLAEANHSVQAQRDLALSCERMAQVAPPALGWLTRAVGIWSSVGRTDDADDQHFLAGACVQLGKAYVVAGDEALAGKNFRRAAEIFAKLRRAGALKRRYEPQVEALAARFPDVLGRP